MVVDGLAPKLKPVEVEVAAGAPKLNVDADVCRPVVAGAVVEELDVPKRPPLVAAGLFSVEVLAPNRDPVVAGLAGAPNKLPVLALVPRPPNRDPVAGAAVAPLILSR